MLYNNRLELIVGPMFSGKTEYMISMIKNIHYSKKKYLVFSHTNDNLYSKVELKTHYGLSYPCYKINCISEIENYIEDETEFIFIDGIQFFDSDDVISQIEMLLMAGYSVICNGIDVDFRDFPFKHMGELLCKADKIKKMSAICAVCGTQATKTQRLIDGIPAKNSDPIILIEGDDVYEPRCRKHHIVQE